MDEPSEAEDRALLHLQRLPCPLGQITSPVWLGPCGHNPSLLPHLGTFNILKLCGGLRSKHQRSEKFFLNLSVIIVISQIDAFAGGNTCSVWQPNHTAATACY